MHLHSGQCKEHLPSNIPPDADGSAQFAKIAGTATGSVGVFTYDMTRDEENKKMAIMWSVPFDYNVYSNWYAMGIYDDSNRTCDSLLFKEMYYHKNSQSFSRYQSDNRSETYQRDNVRIKCKMTNCCEPTLIIDITSTEPVQDLVDP